MRTADGASERFDAVVMATHADQALDVLHDADGFERAALGGLRLLDQPGRAPHRRARPAAPLGGRASWNVDQEDCARPGEALTMTYHMNRLQSLAGPIAVLRLGQPRRSRPTRPVIVERAMSHPMYTFRTLEAQAALRDLQGWRATYFAGAHLGYGFHEDGCRSGWEVAELIQVDDRGAGRMNSHLLEGIVRHRRVRPFAYALEHGVFYVALDLDELDEVPRRLRS